MNDWSLQRFLDAQVDKYDDAVRELLAGKKRSHWMWFIFPQAKGLGESSISKFYAIHSRDEALAFLTHAVLGSRLRVCTEIVLASAPSNISKIFGFPDDLKFRSSMSLFALVSGREDIFWRAIDQFYDGQLDNKTLVALGVT